jgi:outer membrane protein assembly factor BamA
VLFRLIALVSALLALAPRNALAQASSLRTARCGAADLVRDVQFVGNPKFHDADMALLIANVKPDFSFLHLRRVPTVCVDTLEVQRDALRLAVLHRQHGWFLASVTPHYARSKAGVALQFDINAGPATRIDTVITSGLPVADGGRRAFDGPLLALQRKLFDRVHVQAVVDTVVNRLRDAGYARASQPTSVVAIDTASASDSTPATVTLSFTFEPGPQLRIGEVHVRVQGIGGKRTLDSAEVMALTRLRAGQRFRATNVLNAQRDLYRTDAFRLVLIDTIAPRLGKPDSVIDLQLTVAEARTRSARVGAGWATQDCGRLQARVQDRAFLAPGRRAEVTLRTSKIGIGAPVDFAKSLCAGSLRQDPFSQKINYYAGTTVSNTRFFGTPFAPVFSLYSERRGEPLAYLRETEIGTLFELSSTRWRRTVVTPGLQYERGRTISDPLISCTRFNLCQPRDESASLFGRGVGVLSTSFTHDRTNDLANPTYGSRYRAEGRAGITSTSTRARINFYRTSGEVSAYAPFFGGIIATRAQIARVFAPGAPLVNGSALIPQQERLFAGGQNSVRGFGQNLLGPVVYAFKTASKLVVDTINGQRIQFVRDTAAAELVVPRGGTAQMVANLEWRRRVQWPTDKLQVALFADAGTVFESNVQNFEWRNVRVTPGFGVRLDTPLGPFRVDLGYNPHEAQRGRALFYTGKTSNGTTTGAIQCVSPGNTIALPATGAPVLDLSRCPETYRPPVRGALSRFVFHFSLGQAF